MESAVLNGKSSAVNPHVWIDEEEVASEKPRHGPLFYNTRRRDFLRTISATGAFAALGGCLTHPRHDILTYGDTLRDGCWLYGHDSGDHDGLGNNPMNFYNVPMSPELPVAEAAHGFGLDNVCVCRWGRADDRYIRQYRDLKRVSWAITGAKSCRYPSLLEHNFALLEKMPNLVAFDLDDYFRKAIPGRDERIITPAGERVSARAALPYEELQRLRARAHARTDRNLALQLVVYDYMLREEMRPVFDSVDIVQYWTWCGKDISDLPERFRYYRRLAPGKPTFLGIYMWDYGNRKPLELSFMKQQLEVGFDLWKEGAVSGFVFHCSNLLNKNLPPAEYARAWFAEHADETRATAVFRGVPVPPETVAADGLVDIPDLSVSCSRVAEIRAVLDADGRARVPLRIGGDECLQFEGQTGRQILACGTGRVLVVEPSGRVVWHHDVDGAVTCARLKDRTVYYAAGALKRVDFSLPCDSKTAAETVYAGPSGKGDVTAFDFAADGSIVAVSGDWMVELNPETFVPNVWIRTGTGARTVRKLRNGNYLVAFRNAVREYDAVGGVLSELKVGDRLVADAIRLSDGGTLVACGDEVREYAAKGTMKTVFSAADDLNLPDADITSLQQLRAGDVVMGVGYASSVRTPRIAALALSSGGKIAWRLSSAADIGMCSVQKIESREEYD